ncbi:MAG: UDP-N-acetylglucosamine 2-epimerase (non-hydrolyzing) [Armatimonadetes bacterium]|nr:UDP-N-acetylglucosamine 2-epimerase (non-hydrolyzing) [Armatimonadota bacterium]
MDKPRLGFIVGTRPEAIKVAPVVLEFRKFDSVETLLISSGQHREMLDQSLAVFGLKPDIDLGIMTAGQTLTEVTSRALEGLTKTFKERGIARVFAQGDTTTTFCAALAAFYLQIPFDHIEAGLRTDSISTPFPEEFNRRAAGLVASLHYPPTKWAAENLLKEGKDPKTIHVTGNTGIDAVNLIVKTSSQDWFPEHPGRVILLTTHRRENLGEPMSRIATAAREVLEKTPDALLVVPMHRNPQVREVLMKILGDHERVRLIEPPDYEAFVPLMKRAALILTDSGGVQEEAPALGRPVLVLRDTTERPEGVEAGAAKLVGTDQKKITGEALNLLNDKEAYHRMQQVVSPYGDGMASQRVRYWSLKNLGIDSPGVTPWG